MTKHYGWNVGSGWIGVIDDQRIEYPTEAEYDEALDDREFEDCKDDD